MKLIVQIKFNSEKERITKFGDYRYLVYLKIKKEEEGAMNYFLNLMSKEIGIPIKNIHYSGKHGENYHFELN
jgi:hypothetical protein